MVIANPGQRATTTDMEISEGWESSKRDGRFDVHYWAEQPSGKLILEVDRTGDGIRETRFEGEEAERFLENRPKNMSIGLEPDSAVD